VVKSSISVKCLWGSARSYHLGPFTFGRPIGGLVLGLLVRPPLPIPRSAIPVNCYEAQHAPVLWPLFPFGCKLWPSFKFSPRAHAGPEAAAVGDEPAFLVSYSELSMLCPPPRSSPQDPWLPSLHPRPDLPTSDAHRQSE
jgi:hypothetical protein